MIANAALIPTKSHQAHIVIDVCAVCFAIVRLLMLAIRNSYLDAKYLNFVI
jgi:hypothetical protein